MVAVRNIRSIERYPSAVVVTTGALTPRSTLVATSTTGNTISYGQRTFTVREPTFSVAPGTRIRVTSQGDVEHWMEGPVVSYDGQTLVLQVDLLNEAAAASGASSEIWDLGVTGERGVKGDLGPPGPQGPTGPSEGPQGEQGIQGQPGPRGPMGTVIKDSFDTLAELQADHPDGAPGDGYLIGDYLYYWDEDLLQWRNAGSLAGPTGPIGAEGPRGPYGHGLSVKGIAGNYGSLPTANREEGDFWITRDNQHGWFWNGTIWVDVGIQPQGPEGPTGLTGPQGAQGAKGVQGDPGDNALVLSVQAPLSVTSGNLRLAIDPPLAVISNQLGVNVEPPLTLTGTAIRFAAPTDRIYGLKGATFEKVWTTGDMKITFRKTPEPGWVIMDDGTIGDAISGANHQNNDAEALFTIFFDDMTDAQVRLYNAAGTWINRSNYADAQAAWNAHCRIALPKMLGRALAIAGAGEGLTNRALGETIGVETRSLVVDELPSHQHNLPDAVLSSPINSGVGAMGYFCAGGHITTTNAAGSATPFSIMQPTSFLNVHIHL